jgi:decaprenylphospho-beta-D-erythro-pentofuranosid-2-ulose 2-reductase
MSMIQRILVIGATSAIAHAVSRRYAGRGARLFLLARNIHMLAAQQADLEVRAAAEVRTRAFEANDVADHSGAVSEAFAAWGGFDAVLVAFGHLPDQTACEASVQLTLATFDTNARSTLALLTLLASELEHQGSGALAVISSVASERGRASNYVYGASKAAVTAFCSGLSQRLHAKGVRVITVLPGFVDTPMTASFAKGALWASPERVARDIDHALSNGFGRLHTPWFWAPIMAIIKAIPERIFVRMKL